MIRMVTPNTNITAGSIDSTFLKDKSVTGNKINTTGASDNQVLSYDLASNTVIWQDISNLDNTFENGIIVSGAQSTFAENVQINADLDLNGDIAISGSITDLTGISADSTFNLSSTANIELDATGYIHADTDNLYVGSLSQAVHITPTTIGPIGSAITITGNLTGNVTGNLTGNVTGNLTGDVTGDVTGDLTGDVDASSVGVSADTFTVPGWTAFGGADFWTGSPLRVKRNGIPLTIARRRTDINFAVMDTSILFRDYDFSGGVSDTDIMANSTRFIATPGGGARRTSSQWTRLRDITVAGTDGTDCEYDAYKTHYELVAYAKTSGNNEVAYSVVDASPDRTQIMNTLEVVARQADSGNDDLSGLRLRYVGSEQGSPDAYLTLYRQDVDMSIDMIRVRDDAGTPKTEFKTVSIFDENVTMDGDLTINGNIVTTQIDSTGSTIQYQKPVTLDIGFSDPSGLPEGTMYFNSTTKKFRGYNGTAWVDLG